MGLCSMKNSNIQYLKFKIIIILNGFLGNIKTDIYMKIDIENTHILPLVRVITKNPIATHNTEFVEI